MTERVQIILEANDMMSSVFRGVLSQFGDMGNVISGVSDSVGKSVTAFNLYNQSLTDTSITSEDLTKATDEARSANLRLAETIASVVIKVLQESYKAYTELAESVRDLSLVSGESAESTSRFIQVLDDFQLTASDAEASAKALKEKGLSPNIETLANLSDEFLKIQDPAERMVFIQENLGRGGAKWVNVLSQGGDALREMSGAISENLILSDEQIKMYEIQRLALDNMSDSFEGFKVQLGQNIGNVVAYASAMQRAKEIQAESVVTTGRASVATITYSDALNMAIAEQLQAAETSLAVTEGYETEAEAAERLAEESRAAEEALRAMTEANTGMLDLVMRIAEETADYNVTLAETIAKYGEGSEEVAKLKEAHADAFAAIASDLLIAKLQADGFTDAEYNMAIAMLESTGQIDSAAAQTALAMDKIASAAQNAGTAGMESFGGIMSKVMEDGVISNEELQAALDELSAESAVEEVSSISTATDEMSTVGDGNIEELQSSVNAFSTASAISEVDALIARLQAIPTEVAVDIQYTVNGETPPPITDPGGQSTSGGGQVFNIANATFIQNESGNWNPL